MDKKEYCKVTVHWENKSTGKQDTRILILRADRLEVAVLKGQIRVERSVHYLDIRRLETSDESRASLSLASGECLQFACTLEADLMRIVCHLTASLQYYLPQLRTASQQQPQLIQLRVPQAWKLDAMLAEHAAELGRPGSDKCGSFSSAYELFCRYTGAEMREEIKWDVETIYFSQGSRAFALADFGHFGQADFAVLLASLTFNDYFTVLNASGIKFSPQMIKFLEMLLTYNTTLLELHLSNCSLKWDSMKALAAAVDTNSRCRIKVLDLSYNQLGDEKAVDRLCALLIRLSPNLERLHLAQCGLSAKALNRVCESLSQGQGPPPLRHLAIDGNEQKGDTSTQVQKCIAKATNLEFLSCINCDFNLDSFSHAFMRGLTQSVIHLDLSGNQFGSLRRGSRPKDQPALSKDWGQLFATCLRLRFVRLNGCRLPPQAVSDLLSGLGANQDLQNVSLELAGNELGPAGAQVLCSCLNSCSIKCLDSLDLTDNSFDSELNSVVEAVCRSSIKHLSIGGNNFKAKDAKIMEEFSELVTDSKCTLESLSVRDARLRERLMVLLNAVGQCRNLTRLDITGNGMQGLGAKFLAKSLYLNSSLTEVQLDDNQIGLAGLREITEALQFNSSLLYLPVPAADVARMLAESATSTMPAATATTMTAAAAATSAAAAVHEALAGLQRGLLKNHSSTHQVTGRDYRLQSELGSYAFSLDHLVGRLESGLKALGPPGCGGDSSATCPESAECERACRAAMGDALSARYLLTGLSGVAEQRPAEATGRCIREELPAPLLAAASADLRGTQDAMLEFLAVECPGTFGAEPKLAEQLRSRLAGDQSQLTEATVVSLLQKSAGACVSSKLSALQLNSALLMNDCMQEAIAHNLQQAEQALTKLMRSKMLQPNLRRSDTIQAGAGDQQLQQQQQQQKQQKQTLAAECRRNKRPISSVGRPKKGGGGGGSGVDLVEIISLDDSGDAGVGGGGPAAPQPLPRRPVGSQSRRLPTAALLRRASPTTADDGDSDDNDADAVVVAAKEEEEVAEDEIYENADPVFEQQSEEPVPQAGRVGGRKLPAGAVPLMGMGPPPPLLLKSATRGDEAELRTPPVEASAGTRRLTGPAVGQSLPTVSREDLARTILRRAEPDAAGPPVPAPKPKPKPTASKAASEALDDGPKLPVRSMSTNDGSTELVAKPRERTLMTLPATKSELDE